MVTTTTTYPIEGVFNELTREFRRFFGDTLEPTSTAVAKGTSWPQLNLSGNENVLCITAEIPGVALEDIELTLEGRSLILSGKRAASEDSATTDWLLRERGTGSFKRNIHLPYEVEEDQIEASAKQGLLEIRLKRREASKPRRIVING